MDVIGVAIDSLVSLGLGPDDFVVKINNREFVSGFFHDMGVGDEDASRLYKIIDNARKVDPSVTKKQIEGLGLTADQKRGLERYLSLKDISDLRDMEYSSPGKESLLSLFSFIDSSGLGGYCSLDVTVVRGLDYYTGTVYEIFDSSERMRAICGGGRYNHLLKEFGGAELPACGFGMGDVVLGEILKQKGLLPEYSKKIDYFLVRITEEELPSLLEAAHKLRSKGLAVEYAYRPLVVKKQMARASRSGAGKALILGRDELKGGKVILKDLSSGEEKRVRLEEILS